MNFEGLLEKMERDGTIFDVTQQRSMLLQSGMGFLPRNWGPRA